MIRIILIIVAIFLLVNLIFVIGIYRLGWDNSWTRGFASFLPLPAAAVDGRIIWLNEVYEYEEIFGTEGSIQFLAENAIAEKEAASRGIFVSRAERDRYARYLTKRFGASTEQAKLVAEPELLKARLVIAALSEAAGSQAYKQIVFVRKQLAGGVEFEKAARIWSQHQESKFIGGELGFLSKEDLPPWLSDAAFGVEPSEISDIVVSPEGYHILTVTARDEQSEPPVVLVKQILTRGDKSQEEILKELKEKYRIKYFSNF